MARWPTPFRCQWRCSAGRDWCGLWLRQTFSVVIRAWPTVSMAMSSTSEVRIVTCPGWARDGVRGSSANRMEHSAKRSVHRSANRGATNSSTEGITRQQPCGLQARDAYHEALSALAALPQALERESRFEGEVAYARGSRLRRTGATRRCPAPLPVRLPLLPQLRRRRRPRPSHPSPGRCTRQGPAPGTRTGETCA